MNKQREQFPEIVGHIVAHWNDSDWLSKLLNRLGYTTDLYNLDKKQGIFQRLPVQHRSRVAALRAFLLRAAGVTEEKIQNMFVPSVANAKWRFARANLDDLVRRRKAAALRSLT